MAAMAEHSRVFTCKFYIQDRTELAGPIIAWLWRAMAGSVQIYCETERELRQEIISTVLLALTVAWLGNIRIVRTED